MNEGVLVTEVAKIVGKKKVAERAINCVLEAAKKKGKIWGMKVALAAIVAALNFSSLAVAASAPSDVEWEKTVAAAKREGKVVVIGPQGNETREALVNGFQRK